MLFKAIADECSFYHFLERSNDMHRHQVGQPSEVRHLAHFNALFTGRGSRVYDVVMVRLTRRLYQRVIADVAALPLAEGKVLDVGTGPGTLVRDLARRLPGLQVYGIDLSEDMIKLARAHARHEHLEERVQFESGDVAHLPYPDQSFDVVVSTISMHHWSELAQPLRELYRVLRPGGRVWIYDFRFVKAQAVEQAQALTPFGETPLEHGLVRTGRSPFALYRRFALQKTAHRDRQHD
jgi:ubiquinone/menaquinone biosynthesis C-methylase UbiE